MIQIDNIGANTKRLLIAILAICGLFLPSSCELLSPSSRGPWDQGSGEENSYEDYQLGALINGVEFHDGRQQTSPLGVFHGPSKIVGFLCQPQDSLISIKFVNLYGITNSIGDSYDLNIFIVADTLSFKNDSLYHFDGSKGWPWEHDWAYQLAIGNHELFYPLPFVDGYLIKKSAGNRECYVITEGRIVFGSFDKNGRKADTVFFDFIAEGTDGNKLDGDMLEVKEGYCKKFMGEY